MIKSNFEVKSCLKNSENLNFCLYLPVFACIWLYPPVIASKWLYPPVIASIQLDMSEFAWICLDLPGFAIQCSTTEWQIQANPGKSLQI